jgi:hypothetical protein
LITIVALAFVVIGLTAVTWGWVQATADADELVRAVVEDSPTEEVAAYPTVEETVIIITISIVISAVLSVALESNFQSFSCGRHISPNGTFLLREVLQRARPNVGRAEEYGCLHCRRTECSAGQ